MIYRWRRMCMLTIADDSEMFDGWDIIIKDGCENMELDGTWKLYNPPPLMSLSTLII
jgi:hypothetical protein